MHYCVTYIAESKAGRAAAIDVVSLVIVSLFPTNPGMPANHVDLVVKTHAECRQH